MNVAEKETTRLTVLVPEDERDAAKERAAHGEISRNVREVIHHMANGEAYEFSDGDLKTREDVVDELANSEAYPSDWSNRRQDVFRRDNYLCQNCGDRGGRDGTKTLVAHHIVPATKGGNHYLSNLTTLCEECHEKTHTPDLLNTL